MANYIEDIVRQLKNTIEPQFGPQDNLQMRMYAILVLTTGTTTTEENVHDAWAVYKTGVNPDHKDLVQFSQLSRHIQEVDILYRDAIRKVAAQIT